MGKNIKGIYIIEFESGIKFGMSEDILSRIRYYMCPWCFPVVSIHVVECQYPRYVEQRIKDRFSQYITSSSSEFITDVRVEEVVKALRSVKNSAPSGMNQDKSYHKKTIFKIANGKIVSPLIVTQTRESLESIKSRLDSIVGKETELIKHTKFDIIKKIKKENPKVEDKDFEEVWYDKKIEEVV